MHLGFVLRSSSSAALTCTFILLSYAFPFVINKPNPTYFLTSSVFFVRLGTGTIVVYHIS